jgi:hypothetical protein
MKIKINNVEDPGSRSYSIPTLFGVTSNVYFVYDLYEKISTFYSFCFMHGWYV